MSPVEVQTQNSLQGRQRLAWLVVLGSFFLCVALTITLPLSINAFIQNATRRLTTVVQANQGTVGITAESGQQRAVFGGGAGQAVEVAPDDVILTDTNASALLLVTPPEASEPLARLQLSSNTTLALQRSDAPRFGWSSAGYRLGLELESGRVRVNIPAFADRPLTMQFFTPQGGTITIEQPGQYSIEVNDNNTQVTVLESGAALVEGNGQGVSLLPGQRASFANGGVPSGPLDPTRNLVRNGDFSQGLRDWVVFAWFIDLAGQPEGSTEVRPVDGDQTLRFVRDGLGHADVQLSQTINQDIFGASSLELQLTMNIVRHSLGVCGSVGSECPLFVRLEYIDEGGINRTWQHGFYAEGTVDDNSTPDACTSCALIQQLPHEHVPLNQPYFYEVDLFDELARQGYLPPRFIQRIFLIASGHTFEVEVSDVALIVEE